MFSIKDSPGGVAGVSALLLFALACDRPAGPSSTEVAVAPVFQIVQECTVFDQETEEVIPGVTLTWTSSFWCADAPDNGSYHFTVTVENASTSNEAARIDALALRHTSPRPGGQGPAATADAQGLPLTVAAGSSGSFDVSGTYTLVQTDEGKKANIHLTASGEGASSGLPFELGINAHLRAAGAVEDDGGNRGPNDRAPDSRPGGPPAGLPGRP